MTLPPAAATLLASLRAEEVDRERILVWASCGFNATAAATARPDLGNRDTFRRTARRYRAAMATAVREVLGECVSHESRDPS